MIAATSLSDIVTLDQAISRLGGIALDRIRIRPAPGTATESDVVEVNNAENRLCELVDGVLVEKPMGFLESRIAAFLVQILGAFVEERDLGIVTGADGMVRLATGLVRIPDASVILWDRMQGRIIPREPIPRLAPDLAVEVLSVSNTSAEMDRKVGEYFAAGTQLVWVVDPAAQEVSVYLRPDQSRTLRGGDSLTAEPALSGFSIRVDELFRRAGVAR